MNWFHELRYFTKQALRNLKNKDWKEFRFSISEILSHLQYPFYRTYRQIKCIWSYLPVLIGDRDWDFQYFLMLIRHKLSRMENSIRYGMHVDCDKDADEIKEALVILDRMITGEYCKEEHKAHDNKWGRLEIISKPSRKSKYVESYFERENARTPEEKRQELEEMHVIWNKEYQDEVDDYEKFFGILRDKLRKWWT